MAEQRAALPAFMQAAPFASTVAGSSVKHTETRGHLHLLRDP
jgi:hypothetical protein